jgi:predicted ester cyclase
MTHEESNAFVRRYLQEIFSEGDFTAIDEFATQAFQEHAIPLAKRWRQAFPDMRIEVEGTIVEGERVVTEELMTGTHEGVYESEYLGSIAPTGKSFSWHRIAIRDLKDGKFAEGYWRGEELELLQQLGIKVQAML